MLDIPELFKIFFTLGLILAINSLAGKLLPALLGGALVLALWTGQTFESAGNILLEQTLSSHNLLLLLAVAQVMCLGKQMQESGLTRELVASVRGALSRRGAMAVLPGLIGFLPMPGGALFSAPMLQDCDRNNHADKTLKASVNHWFRHVWECWWPMFPGVLLTMELTGFDIPQMILLGLPISLAAITFGYLFLLRRIPAEETDDTADDSTRTSNPAAEILRLSSPVWVAISAYALVRLGYNLLTIHFPDVPPLNRYLPMNAGLALAACFLQFKRPLPTGKLREIFTSRNVLLMMALVLAVRIYGGFIEAETPEGYQLVEQTRQELTDWGIPILAMVMILPFVTGLATGMAVGYVGASFPIILSFISETASFGEVMSITVVAYGFGYIGFVLSPVHVCLAVSSKYFETSIAGNIKKLALPAVMILLFSLFLGWMWGFL